MNENLISLQDAAEGLAGGVNSESEMWLSLLISDVQEGKLSCLKNWTEHRGTSPGGISFDRQPHEWRVLRVTLKTWMEARAVRQAFGYLDQPAPVVPKPQATTPSPAPVETASASGGMNWTLNRPQRFPGYSKPLYDLLKAAHMAGQPSPKARDVLDKWKENPPPDVATVTDNGLKYYDANGNTKPADLEAIRKAIDRMIR